jgi:predicted ATPase/DNA-binding SARP family transcriptional activator
MGLEIAILGPLEPRSGGEVLHVPPGKQRALLCLLSVRAPHPVAAEVAAEALWPEAPPADATRSLQVTVSRLRRSLAPAGAPVETLPSGYRLAVADDAIDARRFEALVERARAIRAQDAAAARRLFDDALALWRGPALADAAFEGFAQGEIARLEELRLVALEERLNARLGTGEAALVVGELEQLAAEHPSRERLVGLLMLALYRAGRQADALDAYTRARRRMDEELGLGPVAELQQLQAAILRQDASLTAPGAGESPPEGLVTMLFTDIEGSTRMARAAGTAWPDALAIHHDVIVSAVQGTGGHVEGSEGDALFAYFVDPSAALAAARAAQAALAAQQWPGAVDGLRVRMGIHTGLVSRAGTGYGGLEVQLTARIAAAGHGGQVVVSAATRALLDAEEALADMGEHRLKDFPAPERLWLLLHDERGPGDFPPLRTEPVRPTNLPADARRLIGREAELEALWDMLTGRERLVTILGFGGTGKTRVALAAAEGLLSAFEGGVWLIRLAGVREPDALLPSIAAALEVGDPEGGEQDRAVARRLRARPTLLVLDNFEQIVEAAPTVAALLDQAPGCRVLVTSQLPLRIGHERLLRLKPLPEPAAVRLFAERAQLAAPDFDPADQHETVKAICDRLDGMPLAIELAAARVAALAPSELLSRLDRSLTLLTRGPRDLAERHRSLHAALEWTHALLEPAERTLFARLGAFTGPAPLDAVETVAAVPGEHRPVDAVEALSGLIDASLVRRVDDRDHGVRYTIPQAARDFAAERLAASGDEHAVRCAQAVHVAVLGEACRGVDPDAVRARVFALDAELRPALAWTRAHERELHARLAVALGVTLIDSGRSRDAFTELGFVLDRTGIAGTTGGLAALLRAFAALMIGSPADGEPLIEPGLAALRAAGDESALALGLQRAGLFRYFDDDPERGLDLATEELAIARRRAHVGELASALLGQAACLTNLGRLGEAELLLDELAALMPQVGDSTFSPDDVLADIAFARGEWARAAQLYAANAARVRHMRSALVMHLGCTAIALAHLGADEPALEVEAAATSIAEAIGEPRVDKLMAKHVWVMDEARARIPQDLAALAASRGRELPESDAGARAVELSLAACAPRSGTG